MNQFFVGCDLGQVNDYTALAVIERTQLEGVADPMYTCPHLERVPLGTSYEAVAERVRTLLEAPQLRGATLIIDATGVGRPVLEMMQRQGMRPVPVTIHGGDTVTRDGIGFRTPKRDLVGAAQILLQSRRLKFAKSLPDVPVLVKELQNMRVKLSANGHDSYEHRGDSDHDDLVLAVCIAVWYAERPLPVPNLRILGL